ncbi:GNAT family N-acetyltransferase [Streptomyces sp. NBC_01362]|uniref:GNAT family N-acetyltransferase n=1 Tax=Streptomyces sp. NBC_01362 TaxID=2903839 RepID=UPI002E2F3AC2|nr:GNAT family N-acetyltransferase [Streptomyces sp. NBC_01362]
MGRTARRLGAGAGRTGARHGGRGRLGRDGGRAAHCWATAPRRPGRLDVLRAVPDRGTGDAWGRGVGGALHREFVALAAAAGCAEGVLECWASNTRAQRFYARNGWRPDGARRPGPLDHDYVRLAAEARIAQLLSGTDAMSAASGTIGRRDCCPGSCRPVPCCLY